MIRLATAALLASLLAGTAMAASITDTAAMAGSAVGQAASSAASSVSSAAKSVTSSAKTESGKTESGEFADEAAAKASCPKDTVVWANTSSQAYHMQGGEYYGKTKKGAYMCQKAADSAGFHPAKKAASDAKPAPAAKTN